MSTSDAYIEITCDSCFVTDRLELSYVYHSYSGESGQYDDSDSALQELAEDLDWMWISDTEHYCCPECYDEAEFDNREDDRKAGIDPNGCDTTEEKFL